MQCRKNTIPLALSFKAKSKISNIRARDSVELKVPFEVSDFENAFVNNSLSTLFRLKNILYYIRIIYIYNYRIDCVNLRNRFNK